MSDFKKKILIKGLGLVEFNFTHIFNGEGIIYFVGVMGKDLKAYSFNMKSGKINENEKEWKINDAPKVPDWIMSAEKQLSDAINEGLFRK